jgi:hypothetical protein
MVETSFDDDRAGAALHYALSPEWNEAMTDTPCRDRQRCRRQVCSGIDQDCPFSAPQQESEWNLAVMDCHSGGV